MHVTVINKKYVKNLNGPQKKLHFLCANYNFFDFIMKCLSNLPKWVSFNLATHFPNQMYFVLTNEQSVESKVSFLQGRGPDVVGWWVGQNPALRNRSTVRVFDRNQELIPFACRFCFQIEGNVQSGWGALQDPSRRPWGCKGRGGAPHGSRNHSARLPEDTAGNWGLILPVSKLHVSDLILSGGFKTYTYF